MSWAIEYWNPVTNKVERFDSTTGSWGEAPKENVIYVYVTYQMRPPYGNLDTTYTTILKGKDYYWLQEIGDALYFGGYNDALATPTSVNSPGNVFVLQDGNITREMYEANVRPEFVAESSVVAGVWVLEPWATMLGLSRGGPEPRTLEREGP